MSNQPVQPFLCAVKEEPFMTDSDTDEKPYVDLINSKSVPSGENSQLLSGSSSGMAEMDDIEYWTISGKKPYFDIILAKSHVGPRFQLFLPTTIVPELPSAMVPVVLTSCGKNWNTVYYGDRTGKRFGPSWKKFASDNELKTGDCCFFELMESTMAQIKFKVIILRGDLPVLRFAEGDGETPEKAIIIE
ncbi:B3 domain-containing protein Os04g0386900-like isoform X1 [Coffea arabica]|uniref:B3 domain-containing protein Os04g0386900-like isoform X1 n=2 Tax=Coffea arabica TaxID=13443 RepID=A0A6P6TQ51_COFAR|nr:B3 domain-containing protein Os06g0112300-like isoform X1 [Coffea arabica]